MQLKIIRLKAIFLTPHAVVNNPGLWHVISVLSK